MVKNDLSRRKVLATAGAITVGFGASGTVVARERDDPSEKFTRQMIQAQQIAKQEGLEERQKYLDRIGINHMEKDHQFAVQKKRFV
ncbi:hypothetical protein [Natrinema saccharevitans]|uniref:hypothetical protein n=1 Tax=Natrinema saccharevitans TaxID=301967 RepID=UPI001FE8AF6B|nr:hypothetical protein [Natrinema saccharevitans]